MAKTTSETIQTVAQIQAQIASLTEQAGRPPHAVQLLAVTKGQPLDALLALYEAGVRAFGESYWQEAASKIQAFAPGTVQWHFIGHLQRNKLKKIAQAFDWVHAVCRIEEVESLAQHRAGHVAPLQICLQVHVPHALGRRGVSESDLQALAMQVIVHTTLRLRGLMVMLSPRLSEAEQLQAFHHVTALKDQLNATGFFTLDTLSMGMSSDFKAAIQAGSTLVRIGRGLFSQISRL